MFKNIIWDLDGTLMDTYPLIFGSYERVISKYSDYKFDMNEIKKMFRETSGKNAVKYICSIINITYDEFMNEYHRVSEEFSELKEVKLYDGTKEFLKDFKEKGNHNFIVTNRSKTTELLLDMLEIREYFDDAIYIGSYDIKQEDAKPNPKSYQFVIDKYNLNLEETLSVGDTDLDIITSKKVNLKTCLIRPIESYSTLPDYVAKDINELKKIIEQSYE